MDILATAASGLNSAVNRFNRASTQLLDATSGDDKADAPSAIADMVESKAQFGASLATVRMADEMMKALLDITSDHPTGV